ncbi:unnamed protein product [Periconia digitata]|uniref:Uncharacterized protein n=1 Tax=Periconia digitata TaxID=1303443 RepID=A0A9W4U8T7_9PLEO|nr:unnamed protein product [Periconia digitata]
MDSLKGSCASRRAKAFSQAFWVAERGNRSSRRVDTASIMAAVNSISRCCNAFKCALLH